MYEENNGRKKTKLPVLIGVLSMILVLTVGGVYAYFAARATNSGQTITGQTLDINGATLSIAATRVTLVPSPAPQGYTAPVSDNLVPANFGVTASNMTTTEINRALDNYCEGGGYTGCHVWKITATSTQTLPSANVNLNLRLVNVTVDDQWSYIVYTGTDSSATTILNKGIIANDFPSSSATIDIHDGAGLTANTSVVYYVMVYLNNVNSAQNDGETVGTTDERGTYNGTVTLEAMGGQVKVDFIEMSTPLDFFEYELGDTSATYTVSNQSACESYFENKSYTAADATSLCTGGNYRGFILEDYIVNEADIPSSDYSAAGLSNVNIVEGMIITGYHEAATYTVTDQSACESYIQNLGAPAEMATTFCSGGSVNGATLGVVIANGDIPSSDYAAAGLSNVVITPAPTDVVIPSTIDGYPVRVINSQAFSGKGLTSVVIPSSVVKIDNSAFYDNSLTSVTILNGTRMIKNSAFYDNSLTSITLPSSVIGIDGCAFFGNSFQTITIENENVYIGAGAFGYNPPLSEPFSTNYVCYVHTCD